MWSVALSDLAGPASYDLRIVAGDSFARTISIRDGAGAAVDLTGLTGRAQIRDRPGGTLLADVNVVIATPATGDIAISLTTAQTRALPTSSVWDLELDGGPSSTHTIVSGRVIVIPDVTVG